jgi:predicted DNA-binding protein
MRLPEYIEHIARGQNLKKKALKTSGYDKEKLEKQIRDLENMIMAFGTEDKT